jgi:hypothetical protein
VEVLWAQSVKHDDNDDDEDSDDDGDKNGDTGNGCKVVKCVEMVHDHGQLQLLGLLFVMVKFWIITTVRISVSSAQIMDLR